jgi:polyhydroxyalkanoate synthesis repressor PhaR
VSNPEAQASPETAPVVVKKYANRRLYDTAASAYVTLEDLSAMVKSGVDFVVFDAKTNEDITRQVLTQIIVEEENRGQNLLPIQFLRQLIRSYGVGAGPTMLPGYLQMSLDAYVRQQEKLREAFGTAPNFFEDQVRQNMGLFEQAMRMFTPAYGRSVDAAATAEPRPAPAPEPAAAVESAPAAPPEDLAELKQRLDEMSRQIDRLSRK